MAAKRKIVDYSKSEMIAHLRKLADANGDWRSLQETELPFLTCKGDVPEPRPEAPQCPRRPKERTAMSVRDVRHCLRDITKTLKILPSVTNKVMDKEWRARQRAQAELRDFFPGGGNWGRYHSLRQDVERIDNAATRVAKIGVLDDEKRRLMMVAESASKRFSGIEDRRSFLDTTRKTYINSFPEIGDWSPPVGGDAKDTRRMIEVAIDEVDWDSISFGDGKLYFVQHSSGKWLGHTQSGPMLFYSKKSASLYVDDEPSLSISELNPTADEIRSVIEWYASHHRFVTTAPTKSVWLYEEYVELTHCYPCDDEAFQEELATATADDTPW